MRRPNFEIVEETPWVFLIKDIGPWHVFPTVTNGAEDVVRAVRDLMADGQRLEYIDSHGERSVILIKDGEFAGFAPCENERSNTTSDES